ncbi:LPS export ABC transporter periplasmic protein LptC [Chitinibacter sp. SCUT-21]|uniref:LPS export ABC transporter periplasmic protein LptC n=1 Tax=Chitinibacter sp. SCUT-21 TaxID=2970891 RepID=UPI0035A69FDB
MLLLLVGALIFGLSQAAIGLVSTKQSDPTKPDMITQRGVLERFDQTGMKRSVLIASEVRHMRFEDTLLFTEPKLVQTDPGKPVMTVMGVRGKSILKASQVWFYDQVELRRAPFEQQAELIVKSRDVYLDQATGQASSDAHVFVDMGPHHAEARGFIADNNAQTLLLKSKVKMTYVPTAHSALTGSARP